ncbi:MAG: MotA/TolQ/ExbB proton channel family protein [Clostridiaceae bacterium]
MKKMDSATLLGVITGFGCVIWGCMGGSGISALKIFYDMPSIILTIGGSICALLINYPMKEFIKLGVIIKQSFFENIIESKTIISKFTELSKKARKDGLLSLEDELNELDDYFMKKGLQMVVDGIEPETIREIMELEIGEMEGRHTTGIDMLKAWGGYAPAFGMIGTLIGLIRMLANLSDSSKIASGMAVAMITTFYGSVVANLICNPMAAKLSSKSLKESSIREMMLEGILSIQSGVNPRIMEDKLICYLSPKERLEYINKQAANLEGAVENG